MGAGSSKSKQPNKLSNPTKVDQVSRGNKTQKVSSIGVSDDIEYKKNSIPASLNNSKQTSNSHSQNISLKVDKSRTTGLSGGKSSGFQSDSESETEDINDVLEATRREHEERVKEQNYLNARQTDETVYPETYAQRLQREQYKPELGIIRQKTIYRNPEEWQMEEEEESQEGGFDVNKFKQANVGRQQPIVQDRDIFTPSEIVKPTTRTQGPDPDNYYTPVLQKQKSIPKYDMSEEALLAEIEKEYEF